MIFNVVTIFPEAIKPYLNASILGRAQEKKLIKINLLNLRDFATDKYKKVDDSPFGGGPGMVLKIEPIFRAIGSILRISNFSAKGGSPPEADGPRAHTSGGQFPISKQIRKSKFPKTRVILFSTRGKKLDQKNAKRLSKYDNLILICGRYEGVDERVAKYIADEEISIGDYVLSGGELPAMVLIEAVSRQIKGVLGKYESLEEIKGSYPVYTRPPKFFPEKFRRARPSKIKKFKVWSVPKVLLSGNHKKIEKWRSLH